MLQIAQRHAVGVSNRRNPWSASDRQAVGNSSSLSDHVLQNSQQFANRQSSTCVQSADFSAESFSIAPAQILSFSTVFGMSKQHLLKRDVAYYSHEDSSTNATTSAPSSDDAADDDEPSLDRKSSTHTPPTTTINRGRNVLDLFLPTEAAASKSTFGEKLPVLIHVHGGGWQRGDKGAKSVRCASAPAAWFPDQSCLGPEN